MPDDHPTPPNYIAAWRESRFMTQEDVAAQMGTTKGVISLWENGHRNIPIVKLKRLGEILQISPGYLLDHHPDSVPADIRDLWWKVNQDQRRQMSAVLEAMATYKVGGK